MFNKLFENNWRTQRQEGSRDQYAAMFRAFLWVLPLVFLGLFFFYPLIKIILVTIFSNDPKYLDLSKASSILIFTFYQALLSTIFTLLVGIPSAYLFARFDFPGKTFLRILTVIPFMLPTVVVASAFSSLLGPNGLIGSLFPKINIQFMGTLSAIIIAHIFYNTTIVIRLVGSALSGFDYSMEQTARSLGANSFRVWINVLLPLLRLPIMAATLLVFLFDFTSFGVILLLGGIQFSTLEVEIYVQALKLFNLPQAAIFSLLQLLCTLIFSVFYSRIVTRSSHELDPSSVIAQPETRRQKVFVGIMVAFLLTFFAAPLISLPIRSVLRLDADRGQRGDVQYGFTTDYYNELFVNRRNSVFYVPPIRAAGNSIMYATATMFISLLIGMPAAIALARPAKLERYLDPLIMLPLGSSNVMLGFGFILAFGKWLSSPLLVPVAHTLVALPFVIRTLQSAISSVPNHIRQAASSLGAVPFQVWKQIDLPIISRAVLGAAGFAFTISLGEFGATLLVSRPDYPTIPVAIERFLSQPGGLNYGQAMAMATILMVLAALSIFAIEKFKLPFAGNL